MTGKDSIAALMQTNILLTKTNTELSVVIKSLTSRGDGERNKDKKGADEDVAKSDKPLRLAKWCPHCKKDSWHDADGCFETAKNKEKHHKN